MRIESWLDVPLKWLETPPQDGVKNSRLTLWRANYDEARAIARYFRWMAERKGAPGSWRTPGQA